jgi:hypothetical protein
MNILQCLITYNSVNQHKMSICLQRHISTRLSHNQPTIRTIYAYKLTVSILGFQMVFLLLLFVRAQGICPRYTAACRLIVLP